MFDLYRIDVKCREEKAIRLALDLIRGEIDRNSLEFNDPFKFSISSSDQWIAEY